MARQTRFWSRGFCRSKPASYGVDAHEAHTVDEVTELVKAGIADCRRLTLINARTIPVGV
jgi:hypothetical protein